MTKFSRTYVMYQQNFAIITFARSLYIFCSYLTMFCNPNINIKLAKIHTLVNTNQIRTRCTFAPLLTI